MPTRAQAPAVPRLTYLRIKNYRALRDVEFRDLTPLTVFIGPNGSGKSTVLDALDFLAETVHGNLVGAWEKRDRFQGMRTRSNDGPIEFEMSAVLDNTVVHYELRVDERHLQIKVVDEVFWVANGPTTSKLFYFSNAIQYKNDEAIRAAYYSDFDEEMRIVPVSNSYLFFSQLFNRNVEDGFVGYDLQLVNLLKSYRYVHLTDDHLKGFSDAGPREKLSPNGDNLPNVLYYLHTRHPETLAKITAQMRRWVPGLADIVSEITSDERLLLRFKDAPFEKPLPAQYMSDGTMRLAALLTLLYEPDAAGLLGIEEPENELHPRLLTQLAEELMKAAEQRQLLIATHSPFLLDSFAPEDVWILDRGADGYTKATRTADIPNVKQMVEDGSPLGYLWTSNFFTVGDPLASHNRSAAPDAR